MSETAGSYWEWIEPLFDKIDTSASREAYEAAISAEPRPLVILYAAYLCQAEVNNGGFDQLFLNSTGMLVPEAIEGFSAIGMPKVIGIVAEAARRLGTEFPRGWRERRDAMLKASGKSQNELERIAITLPIRS